MRTSAEVSGVVSAATAKSPTHKNQDLHYEAANKDKNNCKGPCGRSPKKSDDKKEGSGNSKKNNDTTPKR